MWSLFLVSDSPIPFSQRFVHTYAFSPIIIPAFLKVPSKERTVTVGEIEYKWRKRELLNEDRDPTNLTSKLEPVLKGPSDTHTLSRVQRVLKRFENMMSEVELTCVDGVGRCMLLWHLRSPMRHSHSQRTIWRATGEKNELSYPGLREKETEIIWPQKNSTHRQGSGMRSLLDI